MSYTFARENILFIAEAVRSFVSFTNVRMKNIPATQQPVNIPKTRVNLSCLFSTSNITNANAIIVQLNQLHSTANDIPFSDNISAS